MDFAAEIDHSAYLDFVVHGLDQISVEEWESDLSRALNDNDSVAALASEVRGAKTDFKLGHRTRDALTKAAQKIRSNQLDSSSSLATNSIQSNLDGLEDAQRALCQEEIVKEILKSPSQNERSAIYSVFQVGNFEEDIVRAASGEFAALEDHFLRDREVAGLAWFVELVTDFPRMYPKAPRARKDSIKARLIELLGDEDIDDEVKDLAEKTYELLGLKPKRKKENEGDT